MPSFTIKVPNNDEGEDLGEYQADYLPRVGDPFLIWHPRVSPRKHDPFCGIVSGVVHEASFENAVRGEKRRVMTTVWLAEEHSAPELFCDCTEEERAKYEVIDGTCENCNHVRHL
jgi:hypothetical protein